jgi:molecular chaperone GrpE
MINPSESKEGASLDEDKKNREDRPDPSSSKSQDWKDKYVRLCADVENIKKQLQRKYSNQVEQYEDQLLKEILPTVDNLEQVLVHKEHDKRCESIYDGVELGLRELVAVLSKHGVKPVDALGKPFNPELHEAVGVMTNTGTPEDEVVDVVRMGYKRGKRLLRPALVLVSAENG